MICRDGIHIFTWSSSGNTIAVPAHLRCQCGRTKQADLDDLDTLRAELAAMAAERAAIIERIDGLADDESLIDAIGFVVDEWNHFSKTMNHAFSVTIPGLEAERDAIRRHLEILALETTRRLNEMADIQDRYEAERDEALAEIERLTAAGIEPSAERALVTSAEAYRLVTEAKDMRQLADEVRRQTARLTEAGDRLAEAVLGDRRYHDRQSWAELQAALSDWRALTQPGDRRAGDAGQ